MLAQHDDVSTVRSCDLLLSTFCHVGRRVAISVVFDALSVYFKMADSKEECKEDDKDDLFSNDGNFLERFKKMEEEKKKKEEQSKKLPPPGPTIPMRRKAMKPHPFGIKKPKGAPSSFIVHHSHYKLYE